MLRIYSDVLEVVALLNPVIEVLERKDPDLANQCRRARSSMPLNLREGSHGRGKSRSKGEGHIAPIDSLRARRTKSSPSSIRESHASTSRRFPSSRRSYGRS